MPLLRASCLHDTLLAAFAADMPPCIRYAFFSLLFFDGVMLIAPLFFAILRCHVTLFRLLFFDIIVDA